MKRKYVYTHRKVLRAMTKLIMLLIMLCIFPGSYAQYIHKIKADSVLMHNPPDTTELNIQNGTRNVWGFLYNRYNGRTEFRKMMWKLDDSTYVFGNDTLKMSATLLSARNGLNKSGGFIELGGPLTKRDTISAMDSSVVFLFGNGSYKKAGKVSNYSTPSIFDYFGNVERYSNGRYYVFSETSAKSGDYWNWDWTIDTLNKIYVAENLETGPGFKWDLGAFTSFNGFPNERPSITRVSTDLYRRFGFSHSNNLGLYLYKWNAISNNSWDSTFHFNLDGNLKIHIPPATGSATDSILVWDASSKAVKKIAQNIPSQVKITADQSSTSTSLTDATGLSFAVNSGTYYYFRFTITFSSAATTTGLAVSVSIPSATIFSAKATIPIAADANNGEYQGWITASNDAVIATGVQAANTNYTATVEGVILPSANGTLQLRFASEVPGSQVTIKNGSLGIREIY